MRSTKPRSRSSKLPARTRDTAASTATGGMIPALRACLRGALFAMIAFIALSMIAVAIAYATPDPDAWITPLALCVMALSPIIGGWIALRAGRRQGCRSRVACGLLCGAIILALVFCLSLCLPDDLQGQWPSLVAWGLRAAIPVFCLLGASMAACAPRKRRKRRR